MKDLILPHTSLCAIVRDEMINPAGGIRRFLRSVMPHVEAGVVVDTGSLDGTKEELEKAKTEFENLEVYYIRFEGYAQARNFSLEKAKTDRALILDADELILQEDYPRILENITTHPGKVLNFKFIDVEPYIGTEDAFGHSERIFPSRLRYFNSSFWKWEYLINRSDLETMPSGTIFHFSPDNRAKSVKRKLWYFRESIEPDTLPDTAPSQTPGFNEWKKFNPLRNNYKGSNLDIPEQIKQVAA